MYDSVALFGIFLGVPTCGGCFAPNKSYTYRIHGN